MNRRVLIALVADAAPGAMLAGSPDTALLRFSNATAERSPVAVRGIDPAGRAGRSHAAGETLCLNHAGRGVGSGVDTPHSLASCSRPVPVGGRDTRASFGRFDRCAWTNRDG